MLIAVAKHYQPEAPEAFLKKLCKMASLKDDVKLSSFTKKEFQSLIFGIKQLAGFTSTGDEEFFPLPKISARFYSQKSHVESYLVGSEHFLSKNEAIQWVETHRLDAVVVHKSDGSCYLRSRPGHHLGKIRLSEKEYGKDQDFEEIVRGEKGKKKDGQCIWEFINGIWNDKDEALKSALQISRYVDGEQVWALANDSRYWGLGDIPESLIFKINMETKVVKWAAKFLKFLLHLSKEDAQHPPVILIAHSQGAMIADLALSYLSAKERKQIRVFTFGGWSLIDPNKAHSESHNFFSPYDLVPKFGSPSVSMLFMRLQEGARCGRSAEDVIDEMIEEDVDYYLDTQNPSTREKFRVSRRKHYQKLQEKIVNITILQEGAKSLRDHFFDSKCYQIAVKNLLEKYKK